MTFNLAIHRLIADKVERDPEVLEIALTNVDRWLAEGHTEPERLTQWRDMIVEAQRDPVVRARLLGLLRSDREEDMHLKGFHPFAGVLSREERRPAILECAYSH